MPIDTFCTSRRTVDEICAPHRMHTGGAAREIRAAMAVMVDQPVPVLFDYHLYHPRGLHRGGGAESLPHQGRKGYESMSAREGTLLGRHLY